MFEILLIFLFIILPAIMKSKKDKKKIEKQKRRRAVRIPTSPEPLKSERAEDFDEKVEEYEEMTERYDQKVEEYGRPITTNYDEVETFFSEDDENKKDRYYENIFEDVKDGYGEDYDIQIEILDKEKGRTGHNYKGNKEDILKGIIFSEILSEPRSLKNRKNF